MKKKKKINKKKISQSKKQRSLLPLLSLLLVLLSLSLFMTFSEKSSLISDLFSKNANEMPVIVRPVVEQDLIIKPEEDKKDFFVTTEIKDVIEVPQNNKKEVETSEENKTMKSRLFYIKVSDEGQINLKSILRQILYKTTPLTETIKSLITGPDRSELNKGLLNLIPKKTELLSIRLNQGIAYINFNEEFRFNSLGIEGYKAQLMQIVYTATEFDSVDKVQIVIDGKTSDYLGAEGIFIGDPMDRDYFNTF